MKDHVIIDALCEKEGIVSDGDGSWSNNHSKFDFSLFRCYYCLNGYHTWEESRDCKCDKLLTPAQMIR